MHAIVTGGSSGIGLATARALAGRGMTVSLLARRPDVLEAAAGELRGEGAKVHTASVDVADQDAVSTAVARLEEEAGPCTVLVTSAGQARPGRFLELDDEVFRQMMEVDYFGTLHTIRAVAPGMAERRTTCTSPASTRPTWTPRSWRRRTSSSPPRPSRSAAR